MPVEPPPPPEHLVAHRDIDIIAAARENPDGNRVAFAVRWALRPDLLFPTRGFWITRSFSGNGAPKEVPVGGTLFLPGSGPHPGTRPPDFSEYLDFQNDAQARNATFWDESEEDFKRLLPVLA